MFGLHRISSLLSQSSSTEAKVYLFLDQVTLSHQNFFLLWKNYLKHGASSEQFAQALIDLQKIEQHADTLKREIEQILYQKTLIPDLRSDVATLIQLTDKLINRQETIGLHLKIERPEIPVDIENYLIDLLHLVGETIDHTVLCARSFFADSQRVREYHLKVILLEDETNKLCNQAKIQLFSLDLPLINKVQLRYFFDRIDNISNIAEAISDRISIYTLKRAQ